MRRQIAVGLMVSLLFSGTTVWAQEEASGGTYQKCGSEWLKVPYRADEWQKLSGVRQSEECVKAPRPIVTYSEVDQPMRSPKLAVVGLFSIIIGMSQVLHFGEDTKNVFGSQYCVSDYGDVEYGSCRNVTQEKIGLIMMGAGAGMMVIGMQKVTIKPSMKGVTATVAWGGRR